MSLYQASVKDGIQIVTCPANVELTPELEESVQQWLKAAPNVHVIDLKDVKNFDSKAYRPFIVYNQGLKTAKRRLFMIHASEALANQFSKDGMLSVFQLAKDLAGVAQKLKETGKPGVDVEFIHPFVTGTLTVLEAQANTKLKTGTPHVKKPNEVDPVEIAGVIQLTNPMFTGTIALCFKSDVFLKIYENMVGEKHTTINPEIEDAAGELLNIIFGQAKTILNDQKGYKLERALPTIMVGEKLKLRQKTNSSVVILPFESAAGPFHIEIVVEKAAA